MTQCGKHRDTELLFRQTHTESFISALNEYEAGDTAGVLSESDCLQETGKKKKKSRLQDISRSGEMEIYRVYNYRIICIIEAHNFRPQCNEILTSGLSEVIC